MNTCKDKTIDLLNEIKAVCDSKGFRYYISGELAFLENRKREVKEEFNNGAIAVFAGDVEELIAELDNKEERKVESLANNKRFPGFYLRYMDTSTTLIDYSEAAIPYDTHSLGINIEIICGRSRKTLKNKLLSKLKEVWVRENTPYYVGRQKKTSGLKEKLAAIFFKGAKHNSHIMKSLFYAWLNAGKQRTKTCEIATARGNVAIYRAGIFDSVVETEWSILGFNIVKDSDNFIDHYFDEGKKIKPVRFDIYASDMPWEESAEIIRENNIPLKKYQKDEQKYLSWRTAEYKPLQIKRRKYYSYMFLAEDRMLFYKEFNGDKKNEVISLSEKQDHDGLREILQNYIEKIYEYDVYNIGLCFDSDIFEITLRLLIHDAYVYSSSLSEFKKKSRAIVSIAKNTNYRHYDSVENVFWGEREAKDALEAIKKQIIKNIKEKTESYYSLFKR